MGTLELIDRCFGSSLPLLPVALAFHRRRFLTVSSWTQATGRRNDLYRLSGLSLCPKAIARLFFFFMFCFDHIFPPRMTTAIRVAQVFVSLIRWKRNSHFKPSYSVNEKETVFGCVFGSFTVGEVFACTLIFFFC